VFELLLPSPLFDAFSSRLSLCQSSAVRDHHHHYRNKLTHSATSTLSSLSLATTLESGHIDLRHEQSSRTPYSPHIACILDRGDLCNRFNTEDLAWEQDANVLLLGCGDVRNILFTIFSDVHLGLINA
jgi:hypothetical protein